jgi:nucleoside-diphosphate-sugar epimerase
VSLTIPLQTLPPLQMADFAVFKLVLITGATGHVGFRTLLHALSEGYAVRAAVRSEAKANTILSHPLVQAFDPGYRLSFIIVPDLAEPSAYDEAVQDVDYIIHIASPLAAGREGPHSQHETSFIRPAVCGTLEILEAAKRSESVQRVVITSSIVALTTVARLNGLEHCDKPVLPTDRVPLALGPHETEFEAYAASKVAALLEAEAWIEANQPAFDVIHLHPSFVEGRNDLAMSMREVLRGTNAIVLGIVLGRRPSSITGASVHLEDVARSHVQALDSTIPGNRSYILSQSTRWDDVKRIVETNFPGAVDTRVLPKCGTASTHEIEFDASLTEEVFGFTHLGFEEQVKSVVAHYLELRTKKRVSSATCGNEERGLRTFIRSQAERL